MPGHHIRKKQVAWNVLLLNYVSLIFSCNYNFIYHNICVLYVG